MKDNFREVINEGKVKSYLSLKEAKVAWQVTQNSGTLVRNLDLYHDFDELERELASITKVLTSRDCYNYICTLNTGLRT